MAEKDLVSPPTPAAEQPQQSTEENAKSAQIERRPQTFVEYDVEALDEIVERRDNQMLNEKFGGPAGVTELFKSNAETGIDRQTFAGRREQFGENKLRQKKAPSFFHFLLEALSDKIIIILMVASVVAIVFGMTLENPHTHEVEHDKGWIEGTAIMISIVIVVLVGSVSNYRKAKKFEQLAKEQSVKSINVVRNGDVLEVLTYDLVPGDIMKIETGMEVTCDGLVVRHESLKMDESSLTGEPDLMEKSVDENPFIVSGTHVEEGNGDVLVIAIGMESHQGRLKGVLDDEAENTPLEDHLSELADQIGYFGGAAAVVLILALSLKEIILNETRNEDYSAITFLNFFLIAVALVAVAIPEGLPLAVTIALAFSMRAMMKDNCMVRVLASCETMGAATAVCSDKTGTLTENNMTVVQGLLGEIEFLFDGVGVERRSPTVQIVDKSGDVSKELLVTDSLRRLFANAVALNSTAGEVSRDGEVVWVGNKTEMGMLQFISHLGLDYRAVRNDAPPRYSYPFSSSKKRMSSAVRTANGSSQAHIYVKGASESILADCTKMFNNDGEIVDIPDRSAYEEVIVHMAKQGNRTIGVACSLSPIEIGDEFPAQDPTDDVELVWIGVVGIQDPMRKEVPAAVAACHSAGLTVRMVTGDNIHTARAIAAKCGFYKHDGFDLAMTGPDFRRLANSDLPEDKKELMALLPRLRILARSSPSDKHALVGLLKEQGEVVAVTGDGTNDAPALKLADVGFAMKSGTDIAKGASAMVLLDDNFASVVNAIRWGRAVNDNIKKFLQFQLTINVGGVLLTIIGSLASETSKEPFNPVQLLWLNVIMDTLAALSLATELPEDKCLTRKPVYKQAPLITNRMRLFIGCHALFQIVMILLLLFLGHRWFEIEDDPAACRSVGGTMDGSYCQQGRVHSTMVFNIFILMQVFNVINARKIYGELNPLEGAMTRSRTLILIFALIGGLQAIAVEFTEDFMQVTSLTARQWGICIGFGALEIVVGILVRFIPMEDHVPVEVIEREARLKQMQEDYLTEGKHVRDSEEAAERSADQLKQEASYHTHHYENEPKP